MGLSTHVENKYGHKQTSNTHKNTHKFLVNLDPGKTPFNILRGKPIREIFKFISLSILGKIHLQTK